MPGFRRLRARTAIRKARAAWAENRLLGETVKELRHGAEAREGRARRSAKTEVQRILDQWICGRSKSRRHSCAQYRFGSCWRRVSSQ